jgi:hypothetical protein
MKYSKREIGKELRKELDKGYNIERISTWACDLFVAARHEHVLELDDILRHISLMNAGPEFEYTEQELKLLVELLINEEENPIKQIDELRFKDWKNAL